jgi:hypothetical protein
VPNALNALTASAASPKRKRVGAMVAAVIGISREKDQAPRIRLQDCARTGGRRKRGA